MKFSKIISLCMSILLITAATSCNNTVDDNAPHEDHKEIEEEKPEELTVWIQETFNKEFMNSLPGCLMNLERSMILKYRWKLSMQLR